MTTVFTDETYMTQTGVYGIGALAIEDEALPRFNETFYTTYTMLLKSLTVELKSAIIVCMDDRSDAYDKQDEVVDIVSNRMLSKVSSRGQITRVSKNDSSLQPGLQAADLIVGPIVAAHAFFLNRDLQINRGKMLMIERMSEMLGWDNLWYDTYPGALREHGFNIWQFPSETRAMPGSKNVAIQQPRSVDKDELRTGTEFRS